VAHLAQMGGAEVSPPVRRGVFHRDDRRVAPCHDGSGNRVRDTPAAGTAHGLRLTGARDRTDEVGLWRLRHDDGDEEDLEEHEVDAHAFLSTMACANALLWVALSPGAGGSC
jgi:hypothetical protein